MVSALFVAAQAYAGVYNLTYTGVDGTDATGQIVVLGGYATSGYLDVTGPANAGDYTLVPGSGSDGSFVWDSIVFVGSDPFLDTTGGLQFAMAGAEVNMFYNSGQWDPADTYSLWGAPPNWAPESYGTATLTPVPDGGLTVALLGGALVGLQALRRKLFC